MQILLLRYKASKISNTQSSCGPNFGQGEWKRRISNEVDVVRILTLLLMFVFSSSSLMASDYCFEKYGLEMDRNGLKYQYSVSDGRFSKELSFRSDKGVLSVLVFEKKSSQDKIAEKFELLCLKI